jgi:hypothetical protein
MKSQVCERLNWKWNSAVAAPFYTNSWQQDYPQVGLTGVEWGEDCDRIDINNTSYPKPLDNLTFRKQLSRTSFANCPITQICWMYNQNMTWGTWPGANVTYYPLVGTNPTAQNPIMNFIDANGNYLVLTTFGTTGATAPAAAADSVEGTTVTDGSVVWTVASGLSQGWRVYGLPGATGPTFQVVPAYQMSAVEFTSLDQLLTPIPDNYARIFRQGYRSYCLRASKNPNDQAKGEREYEKWIKSMLDARKQGDKEQNSYGLLPATSPVESIYGQIRNPMDPAEPY